MVCQGPVWRIFWVSLVWMFGLYEAYTQECAGAYRCPAGIRIIGQGDPDRCMHIHGLPCFALPRSALRFNSCRWSELHPAQGWGGRVVFSSQPGKYHLSRYGAGDRRTCWQ